MRIRTIKPEFWGDEKFAPLDPLHRLVFLGLISIADDTGRLLDSVKMIDGILFAYTDDSSREPLANLARMGRIERGTTVSGQRIIQITNWHHQRIDHPNLKGALPPIAQLLTDDSRDVREEFASDSRAGSDSISTNDQRPTTTPSPSARAREYVPEGDWGALDSVLGKAKSPQGASAEIGAYAAGLRAPLNPTRDQLGRAIRDMAANGAEWNARLFRRYVEGAIAEDSPKARNPVAPRLSKQEIGRQHLADAVARRAAERAARGEEPQNGI